MERNMISERTKAGLEAAKNSGKQLGRPSKIPSELKNLARELVRQGATHKEAASKTGMSRQYVSVLVN